jgi:hypothetical protein
MKCARLIQPESAGTLPLLSTLRPVHARHDAAPPAAHSTPEKRKAQCIINSARAGSLVPR